ncbi:MAG: UDP-3-O-(3-hydroxymyristoyl)glucosamine N-acyltransferase [Proteobacteria bacterium]|nr:UDP-3-O-(3-hydroxymyristoyl)glucosamine N-acyltransferase [Pseudomonadota bacterium]
MYRQRFFDKKFESLTLKQVLEITGATVAKNTDLNQKIFDIATLEKADEKQISFFTSGLYFDQFKISKAGFCFTDEKNSNKAPLGMTALIHKNPYFAYAKIVETFYKAKDVEFDSKNLIHPTAKIAEGTKIAPNAYVGKNVEIGKNCFIGPNASVMDNCVIGDNCIINANVVISFAVIGNNCGFLNGVKIGQDGFGFAHNAGINHKIVQLGIVEIGNDVEIGANSCVDRGAIENTQISDGVKIDNLVQIAHNVVIGKSTVMAGCSAVAGSTKIGNFVQIGGGCCINGHITIGDGARIAAMSGVMRNVEPMQVMAGIPVQTIRDWHKLNSKLMTLIKKPEASE